MLASFKFIARILSAYINLFTKIFLPLLYFITAYSQQDSIQFDGFSNNIRKCSVTLTLQKTDYKLFEPVRVMVEVTNQSDRAYDVLDLFSADYGGIGHFTIINDSGKIWKSLLTLDVIYIARPVYFLQPGDTFTTVMLINDYGNEIRSMAKYFNQLGYFPPGKNYTAYYSDKSSKSNEVHFSVTVLNDEDSALINTYGDFSVSADSSYSLIISRYPDNVFTEYLLADKIRRTIHNKSENNLSSIQDIYQSFFKKYPNSYYMYDEYFMGYYYAKLFSGIFIPYSKIIKEIERVNNNSQLSAYLNKQGTKRRIKYIIK